MLIFVKGCQSTRTFTFSYGLEDVLRVFSVAKVDLLMVKEDPWALSAMWRSSQQWGIMWLFF
ncbi:hypothetical protein Hdeb2414_s0004g00122551 [Helianthus debilis subsp. tardiflorus]